jgi:hypothetical protein
MPTSTLARKYTINGVVNTENPVMENLDGICRSAGSFLTYDVHQGLWSVVINTTASSVYSFDDSNIVGPIQVSTTSLFDLYNEVEVEFPLLDTADKTDFVRLEIPDVNRAPYEQDNQLKMTLNFASEPVQASLLGRIELLQSRLDKVVTFESDYSALQLNAGDVIDVTNALYGFTAKTFRIITIKELDADDGSIRCEITALEYDATIYSAANLTRTVRSDLTGIQTLGAIGVPGTPTFVKFEASARPQINVVTTVPTGVIEGVECWISSDGTNYQLRNTIKNADTVLTPGASLTFEFDDQAAGNVYAKTRGTNYSVAGPFSNVGTTTYTPQQITDAISEETNILDEYGVPIALGVAIPGLLNALDSFMGGSPTGLDNVPKLTRVTTQQTAANTESACNAMATGYTDADGYVDANVQGNAISLGWSIGSDVLSLVVNIRTPTMTMFYNALDQAGNVAALNIQAQPAFGIELYNGPVGNVAGSTIISATTVDWDTNLCVVQTTSPAAGNYWIRAYIIPTYQLNQNWVRNPSLVTPNMIFFNNFTSPLAGLELSIDVYQ